MASGMPADDAPPLPPPDYTPQSTAEFAASQQPPLRGLIIDPKYPPTASEATKAFPQSRQPRPDFESERPANLRRSSGASQIFNTAPKGNGVVNTIPGGDTLQPGKGKYNDINLPGEEKQEVVPEATVGNALKSVSLSDYANFAQIPCVRTSLMQGMGVGFVLGGVVFATGRTAWKASNSAVWSFLAVSMGSYQYCGVQRRRERDGMKAAVRIIEEKKEAKKARHEERKRRSEEARDAKLRAEEEERRANWRWWKIWQGRDREG